MKFDDIGSETDVFAIVCATLYDASMMILESACEQIRAVTVRTYESEHALDSAGFCFMGCLVAAVQLAVRFRRFGPFEKLAGVVSGMYADAHGYGLSALHVIILCFLSVYESDIARSSCPELPILLLELYFDLLKDGTGSWSGVHPNYDTFWIHIAYLELRNDEEAAARAARYMFLNSSTDEGVWWILEHLLDRGDSILSKERHEYRRACEMDRYAKSSLRPKEPDQQHWYKISEMFIDQWLQLSLQRGPIVSIEAVQLPLEASSSSNQELWRTSADDVEARHRANVCLPF